MARKRCKKEPRQLKVVWEYDKDVPEEKKQRRIDKVFEVLLT